MAIKHKLIHEAVEKVVDFHWITLDEFSWSASSQSIRSAPSGAALAAIGTLGPTLFKRA
jgi:hypothetical protein